MILGRATSSVGKRDRTCVVIFWCSRGRAVGFRGSGSVPVGRMERHGPGGGRARPIAPRATSRFVETIDRAVAVEAARGTDIVLHALNAPYTSWERMALPHAYSAIEAAETAGATLMFPGNVYNYGRGMPAVLDETTRWSRPRARGAFASRSSSGCGRRRTAACAPSSCAPAIFSDAGADHGSNLVLAEKIKQGIGHLSGAARAGA